MWLVNCLYLKKMTQIYKLFGGIIFVVTAMFAVIVLVQRIMMKLKADPDILFQKELR